MEFRDELEFFDELLSKRLHPKQLVMYPPSEKELSEWTRSIQTEKERIKGCLKKVYYHSAEERAKEHYVQRHQADLIMLKNTVFHYLHPKKAEDLLIGNHDSSLIILIKMIYFSLKELLTFIDQYLPRYFNQEEFAPHSYQLALKFEFQHRIKRIRKKFKGDSDDKEILNRVITTLPGIMDNCSNIRYRKLIYARAILIELESLGRKQDEKGFFSPIRELMFYMNFNCSLFAHFLIRELANEVSRIDGEGEKLLFLYKYQKEIRQLVVKPNAFFRNNPVSLKEQIAGWVEEEIAYWEKSKTLLFSTASELNHQTQEEELLCFSVPVSVLSLLGRSACDSKLVLNKNKKKALSTIARVSKTVSGTQPQENSLLKKSYVAEPAHKERAIGILHEMIRRISKY